ncbi:hypothetical protein PENSPDRAFT_693563 [Peniophora sp. CONT]|nr:hypothetical protein PENSPDRAFT_693563 [Peniophora sp. CONT]
MDAHVLQAFVALRLAMGVRGSDTHTQHGAATRLAAAIAQEANERRLDDMHTIRSRTLEAVDELVKARSSVANMFEGPLGTTFRCQKCDNVVREVLILRACQHRMCSSCLQTTFAALVVVHVKRIAPLLPRRLRQPPPVITDDYLKKLAAQRLKAALHCPLCGSNVVHVPAKVKMISDLFEIARACVYIRDDLGSAPGSANLASYF